MSIPPSSQVTLQSQIVQDFIITLLTKKMDNSNPLSILKYIIEFAENEAQLKSGKDKKELSIAIFQSVCEKLNLPNIEPSFISNTIDIVISASKGEINVNAVAQQTAELTTCCFSFFSNKK